MDKQTLSNYGWVVVLVLILAVLLALATPFGSFVSTAIKDVTSGFWDINSASLKAVGVGSGNIGFPAECDIEGHYTNDGKAPHKIKVTSCSNGHTYTCECDRWVVPDGGKYYIGVTSTTLGDYTGATKIYNAGEKLPCGYKPTIADTLVLGDYEYRYNCYYKSTWQLNESQDCWGIRVLNNSQKTYGSILSYIVNEPVKNFYMAFKDCKNLLTPPELPETTGGMDCTFYGCTSLITAPVIPNNVSNMQNAFAYCTALKTAPPSIPASITNMNYTFKGCTSLTGKVEINAIPSWYNTCFSRIDFSLQDITLTGTSTILDQLGATGTNYCTTCNGKCLNNH